MKSKELRERAKQTGDKIDMLVREARAQARALNEDEQRMFDELEKTAEADLKEADGYERIERHEDKTLSRLKTTATRPNVYTNDAKTANLDYAIRSFLGRKAGLSTPEWDAHAEQLGMTTPSLASPLTRNLTTSGTGTGAEWIPTTLGDTVYEKIVASGGLLGYLVGNNGTFQTDSGEAFTYPKEDATGVTGAILTEGSDDTEVDIATSSKVFGKFWITSKIQKVTYQMLRDSKFSVRDFVVRGLSGAISREVDTLLWNGDPAATPAQPEGVYKHVVSGLTTASPTTFTTAELRTLMFSVPEPHASNGVWFFSRSAIGVLFGLLDTLGRQIWSDSLQAGVPPRLYGAPVYVDYSMDTVAATHKPVVFGDIAAGYKVRLIGDLIIRSSSERYFESNQTGIVAGFSMDAGAIDTATYSCMTMHA